jgi:superfamily II DNA or RNA helicase
MLKNGIYELIINRILRNELNALKDVDAEREKIEREEASYILSKYAGGLINDALLKMKDAGNWPSSQVNLINEIIKLVSTEVPEVISDKMIIDEPLEKLLSLMAKQDHNFPGISEERNKRPLSSISRSSLFTASEDEPIMVDELKKEIITSNQVDLLVSFIRWSGIRLLMDKLKKFTDSGGTLRIITTTYMGATDFGAIEKLSHLKNTQIRISYDTKRTRLHAKAYIFHRDTGFSTAYIGSSNISSMAISSGLEWNVKITSSDLPDTMNKVKVTFESYWNSKEFELYTSDQKDRLKEAINAEKSAGEETHSSIMFDIRPFPFQQEILDKLQAERQFLGRNKNLVVAATGTGKTVIAAFDYKSFCEKNPSGKNRLIFLAHREEILVQAIDTFKAVLKDYNFGSLYVGKNKPDSMDHLFISIQTFNSQKFYEKTPEDFYDFIVLDETHHASAESYQPLFSHYKPKVFLGLTATPERSDGISVERYFDNHISAEIRLPEAIEMKLLSPFQYFGITDSVDLKNIIWKRGGYDDNELDRLYVSDVRSAGQRASLIVASVRKYIADMEHTKGLGFCVSIEHAKFMAESFNGAGISSRYLTSFSPDDLRKNAKEMLRTGEIKFIFVVDIYNEGVDIPEVNTVLFLRPTKSLTVFIQQLGRGLRLSPGKDCLTVLDFIGQANEKYNFEEKFASLVKNSSRSIEKQIRDGFIHLPAGSYIELEEFAKKYILENIMRTFGVKSALVTRIKNFKEDTGIELTLENFLTYYRLDPSDIYSKGSFSRLSVLAGIGEDFSNQDEDRITKAIRKVSDIDSRKWLNFLLNIMKHLDTAELRDLSNSEEKMLNMFQYTAWGKSLQESGFRDYVETFTRIRECGPLFNEMMEIMEYQLSRTDIVDFDIDLGYECPLELHCNYTRDQVLVSLGVKNPENIREGVKFIPELKTDILFVTLNKSDKDYSPTTMYEDYLLSDRLFHWQSQSTTSEGSVTGRRYTSHRETGNNILLFVREFKKTVDGLGAPYTFLGMVNYKSHEGSNPMNIIWELEKAVPAKYMKKIGKLI